MSEDMKKIGKKIKLARIEEGLTQEQLAEKLNFNRQVVIRIESGERRTDLTEIKRIAEVVNKLPSFFLEEKPENKDNGKTIDISDIREEDLDMVYTMLDCLRNRYKTDKREKTA